MNGQIQKKKKDHCHRGTSMSKIFAVFIVLTVFIVECSTVKKNNCEDLFDKNDYTIVNGVAFYDSFNESEYVKNENGKTLQISRYIDPEKMEWVDWFAENDEFRIAKGNIVKAGSIRWDKNNKILIVRDVDKVSREKNGIISSERRFKYKIDNNITYLSEDGKKWSPVKVVINGFYIPSKENYKKESMMIVGLYSDLFKCTYNVYATDESRIKYKSWENRYGVVVIDGKERYMRSEQGNAFMTMSQDYIDSQKSEIIHAKNVSIVLNYLWEKKGRIVVSDGYKNKSGYDDEVPGTRKEYKYVIKDDTGYVLTWDEKDCDELKVKIIKNDDVSKKGNQDEPGIKFSLECKWFKGVYEISVPEHGN